MATTGSTSGAAKTTLESDDKAADKAAPEEAQKQGIDAQGVAPLGGIDGVPTDKSGTDNEAATKAEKEMLPQADEAESK
jgi:hypothetical protein